MPHSPLCNDNKSRTSPNKKVKLNPIHELYNFNAQSKKSKCLVSDCSVSIKGKNASHLLAHTKAKHPIEYAVHLQGLFSLERMELRSHADAAKTEMELKRKQNQIKCKAYRERLKSKKQTEEKFLGIVEELPIGNAAAAVVNQQHQITAIPLNKLKSNRVSDLVVNLSEGNFNSDNTQQPRESILLKAMSDIMVLLESNSSGVSNIPSETIKDVPLLVPIDELSQESSFTTDYASTGQFPQPYPVTAPIEDYSLSSSSTQTILSPEARLILSDQMRKHVQLLTQMHLITAQQSDLKSVTEGCHCMLQNLVPYKHRLEIANLDEAFDLINRWETVVTKSLPEELRKYQRPVVNFGGKKKFLKRSRKNPERFPFNPKMIELMAESRVFIYPELLPKLAVFQAEQGPCKMSPYEDQLIAMGIEQFTPFYADYFGGSQEMVHLICSMVSQFMLPHWTAKQIETRIIAKCLPTSSANPIKVKTYYKGNKVAPSVYHEIQPFDSYSTPKLADISLSLLPERWRALFSTVVSSDNYQLPEQYVIRDASNSSSCDDVETSFSNSDDYQERPVASALKQLKSPSKCTRTVGKPIKTSTTNTTRRHRYRPVTKRGRVVHRHEVDIDLEEIFNIKSEIDS